MGGENVALVWIGEAVALAIGLGIGVFWARKPSSAKEEGVSLEDISATRNEFRTYRDEVGDHFEGTKDTIRDLNSAYGQLFEHLAQGGQKLCNSGAETMRPIESDGEVFARIKRLESK